MQTAKCANGFKLRRRQYLKKLMQMALSLELDSMRKAQDANSAKLSCRQYPNR